MKLAGKTQLDPSLQEKQATWEQEDPDRIKLLTPGNVNQTAQKRSMTQIERDYRQRAGMRARTLLRMIDEAFVLVFPRGIVVVCSTFWRVLSQLLGLPTEFNDSFFLPEGDKLGFAEGPSSSVI